MDILRSEHPGCGVEKMYHTLKPDFIGRDRFIDYMMHLGYRVKKSKNYLRTTIPAHYKYPNLIEGSMVSDINQVWQSDITYIQIGQEYYYLVFILDVYSRKIVGYQASDHLRAEANVKALQMAYRQRKKKFHEGLIHHSDRGSQYISKVYTQMLEEKGIAISIGSQAMDNPYAERVNGTIKNEFLHHWDIRTLMELKTKLKKAVNYYNNSRIHNALPGHQSPNEYERNLLNLPYRKRPTVNIYTDGYEKFSEASSLYELQPKTDLGLHICPIVLENYSIT